MVMDALIEPPIFLIDGHDVTCFESLRALEGWVEAVDVEAGVYAAYDRVGQWIRLEVVADDGEMVRAIPTGDYRPLELETSLRAMLQSARSRGLPVGREVTDGPLDELTRALANRLRKV